MTFSQSYRLADSQEARVQDLDTGCLFVLKACAVGLSEQKSKQLHREHDALKTCDDF